MPSFDVKFGVLAVADGLPSAGENLFDRVVVEEFVDRAVGKAIDGGTQGFGGLDGIGGMRGGGIDTNGLRLRGVLSRGGERPYGKRQKQGSSRGEKARQGEIEQFSRAN